MVTALQNSFKPGKWTQYTILFILLSIVGINLGHHRYNKPDGVIEWDIKSYYAYLPAVFIYHDLSLGFTDDDPEKFKGLVWPLTSPTGDRIIKVSMGMSVLYTPFFLAAHLVAQFTPWEADGYSRPYRFALTFSALFYIWLGLIYLTRVLRRYFADKVVALTLLAVVPGTNLLYYSTFEAPMSHAFSFALIAVFMWQTIRFYEAPSLERIAMAGALAGLITLIRPTNILVLLIFFLWDIRSVEQFKNRVLFFVHHFGWVILMAGIFVLVWVPQFIYWKSLTGTFFFFSYGAQSERFFFAEPQIFNILFSYKKGWLVYTPIMVLAFAGMIWMRRKLPGMMLPLLAFQLINIYILSSWWSWWFGGGFGLRAFIDSYALMAIPMACLMEYAFDGPRWRKAVLISLTVALIMLNLFQTWQYTKGMIHWENMNRKTYWMHFLRVNPAPGYWDEIKKQYEEDLEWYRRVGQA